MGASEGPLEQQVRKGGQARGRTTLWRTTVCFLKEVQLLASPIPSVMYLTRQPVRPADLTSPLVHDDLHNYLTILSHN